MLKHQPFGWIKSKDGSTTNIFIYISGISDKDVTIADCISFEYNEFLECYIFADDIPCGIREEGL